MEYLLDDPPKILIIFYNTKHYSQKPAPATAVGLLPWHDGLAFVLILAKFNNFYLLVIMEEVLGREWQIPDSALSFLTIDYFEQKYGREPIPDLIY